MTTKRTGMRGAIRAFAAVLAAGVALLLFTPRPPNSLAAAFDRHRQDLAGDYCVLLPLSSEVTLGHRATDSAVGDRGSCRKNVEPNTCFFTPSPQLSDSL